ncbi:MAG: class F sortase [Streptosporangiaceae bacterium]
MSGRGMLLAGALGISGLLYTLQGREHHEAPQYRIFGGPAAIWDIPAGPALTASRPVRLQIPTASVDAGIAAMGDTADGGVQVPPFGRSHEAGWYEHSVMPGTRGSSVIVGHYDDDRGGAVFAKVGAIRRHDPIRVIRADGSVAHFQVDALEQVSKALFPGRRVFGDVGYAGLRLVTCGGAFNRITRHFRDNVIIYAHLVRSSPPRQAGPRGSGR